MAKFLYFLGFFSGFAAILYQILWMRSLGLIFGSSSLSIGVSLAAFMGGLGIGGWILGRFADRIGTAAGRVRLYAGLEIGIGLFGAASPLILSAGNVIFSFLYDVTEGHPAALLGLRAVCSFAILLVPTFLMGGTYPAAVRYLAVAGDARGRPLGLFYAVNTLGAAAAAFAFPLILFERLGAVGCTGVAVGCNLLAGAGAFWIGKAAPLMVRQAHHERKESTAASPYCIGGFLGTAFFLSGFAALSLEVLYNRLLVISFGSSIYTYAFILGVFLLCIGIGGRIFSAVENRLDARTTFLAAQAMIFMHIAIALPHMDRIPRLQLLLFDFSDGGFSSFHMANILVTALFVGIPALGFGIGYPAALKSLTKDIGDLGEKTGMWGAANAAGAVLGSLLTTFLGLPLLGSYRTFLVLIVLLGLSLMMIACAGSAAPRRRGVLATAAFFALTAWYISAQHGWDLRYFHTQNGVRPDMALQIWRQGDFDGKAVDLMEVLAFREGTDGTVGIVEFWTEAQTVTKTTAGRHLRGQAHRADTSVSLFVNGKVDASDNEADMLTQSLLAHIPMQFMPEVKSALVVGLGSGVTASELTRYPLEKIEIVEISPDVVWAAKTYFSHVNRNFYRDTRVQITIEDGRHFLATRKSLYDLIVSEPSNAWLSGASNLFTREYFSILKNRLTEEGMLCQWFYTYSMSWENLLTLLATLRAEFPHIQIFNFDLSGDLIILASMRPIRASEKLLQQLSAPLAGSPLGIKSANDLLKGYVGGTPELESILAGRPLHTDDRPRVELQGPKDLFLKSTKKNLFHFVDAAPEATLEWNYDDVELEDILSVRFRFSAPDFRLSRSGLRVISFTDESQTSIQKQSFRYAAWTGPDQSRVEILSPLRGATPAAAHRITLGAFSKRPATEAKELRLSDKTAVTVVASKDTAGARLDYAWNCGAAETEKTFFVRCHLPAGTNAPVRLWEDRMLSLFSCRGPVP